MLGATANLGMYLGASGVSAGGNHYLANVIAGQQNAALPSYAAASQMYSGYWDKLIDHQLSVMSKYITDIDVNFVNELIFDYVFCGHFVTNASTIVPALRDSSSVS